MPMKQFIFTLALAFIGQLAFPCQSFAQDIPDDGEGEEIVIINQDLLENGPARGIMLTPITATLFRTTCCICVEFLDYIGEVTITLTNLSTPNQSSINVNSNLRMFDIPISDVPGIWQICIRTSSGNNYVGFYSI